MRGDDVPGYCVLPPRPKRRTPPYSRLWRLTFSSNTFSRHDRVSKLPLFIWLNEKVRQTCAVLNGLSGALRSRPPLTLPSTLSPAPANGNICSGWGHSCRKWGSRGLFLQVWQAKPRFGAFLGPYLQRNGLIVRITQGMAIFLGKGWQEVERIRGVSSNFTSLNFGKVKSPF